MECRPLGCQVCLTSFQGVYKMKQHLSSQEHWQKLAEVFKNDVFSDNGLSLLTLCFSKESQSFFYLCHVCEEKLLSNTILRHLCNGDHCSNYFNYTDPNMLSYSWIPSMDMGAVLRPQLMQEMRKRGPGTLQMLDLPEKLMKILKRSTYTEVMTRLGENCELNKLVEAVKPKRTMIQTYQRDNNRKHPLIGLQHLVECVCDGVNEKRYYLCTLCKLTLATHMIIKHVLSFDHIFCYFKEWHPSTLLSKECYTHYEDFTSSILDFSKQTEEIHGTANTEMKQVILNPDDFALVNFACYSEALKKLESKTQGSSLIMSVKPGNKLECCMERSKVNTLSYSIVLRCQVCCLIFQTMFSYLSHLSKWKHKQMLMKCFGQAKGDDGYENTGRKPYLGLYRYLQDSFKKNQPVIGVSLIVMCISNDVKEENIYVCFACEESFSESVLKEHLESKNHVINTLLYQNPWRLPFAWENQLEVKDLKLLAWEEENENTTLMMIKIFDMPYMIFWSLLTPSYEKVMMKLQLYHTILKNAVPQRETYRKLKQNERFPLLGKQFMVMYNVGNDNYSREAFLCLLCGRMLLDDECYSHVFSMEHVKTFLDRFHPGSIMPGIDPETVLDLAKQAARIHSISNVQVIKLERPIWEPCTYKKAIFILGSAKGKYKQVALQPNIRPRMKLVPRETVKEMAQDHVRDGSRENGINQPANGSTQNKTSQKSIDDSNAILKTNALEVKPEIIKNDKPEEGGKIETLPPSENQSGRSKEPFSETTSQEMANTGCDAYQQKKEENEEEPTTEKPSGNNTESCHNTDKNDEASAQKERVKYSEVYMCIENEKFMSEKSKEDMCPDENVGNQQGLQQLISKDDASCEEPRNMACSGLNQVATEEKESGKPYHAIAKDKALQTVQTFQTQKESRVELPSTSSQYVVEPVDTSESLQVKHKEQYMTNKKQVVEMEIDSDSEDKLRHSLHVSKSGTNPTNNCPDSTRNTSKDDVTPSTNVEPLKMAKASEILGTIQSSTPSGGTGATAKLTAAKLNSGKTVTSTAPTSSCAIATTKCKETFDKYRATTCSSITATSSCNTTTTKWRETDYTSTATTFSVAAPTSKLTAAKLSCTITTKSTASSASYTASDESTLSSPTVATIAATKITKKCEVKDISAKNSNADFASHIDVSNHPPAVPHQKTAMSDGSENKSPHAEPPHTSMTKIKRTENPPKIGINHLIIVSCEGKQQVYCELCSVRLKKSSHTYGNAHRLNYVKMKYPEWNAATSELQSKLDNVVALLAEVEKDVTSRRCQSIQVTRDVYKELAGLPEDKALEKLKTMKEHRTFWETRSPTTDSLGALRQNSCVSSINSLEISSPEINLLESNVSGFSADYQRGHERNQEVQKWIKNVSAANGLNQSQFSHLSFNKSNPECTPPPSIQQPNTAVTGNQDNSGPGHQSTPQVLPRISVGVTGVGTQGCSNLSRFLNVTTLDTKPILGMGSVWECQGISQFTFYLCEHCRETLSVNDVCRHMVSRAHQINSMMTDYPKFLYFLAMDDVPKEEKLNILNNIAPMFSAQERFKKIDAQVVMLTHELYERVRRAPFSEALEMVRNIKEQKLRMLCKPTYNSHLKDKWHEIQQSTNEFSETEMQSAQGQTAHRHGSEARSKPEKHCLAETSGFDKATKRKNVLGPVHVDTVFSKNDSTETQRLLSVQPEFRPNLMVEQQQAKVHTESLYFSSVDLETAQTLSASPRDIYVQSRKRPALPSVQTYYTTDPQLKDPWQAKYALSSLQAVSQCSPESALKFASVNPALMSYLLSPENEGAGPGFNDRGDIEHF